ncbi:hypothetical protein [Hyphobacterium sp.]|uniref:hypothetical protein n=1 Tax=Hyphobacterium sp. TaxID=2004662 RepID=UPI003BAD44D8
MFVRVSRVLLALILAGWWATAMAETPDDVSVQETPLANLNQPIGNLSIDADAPESTIQFALGPTIEPSGGRLVLNLRPAPRNRSALLVMVNNSRAVRIEPADQPILAEIDLPSSTLQSGTNLVTIVLEDQDQGYWSLDGSESRLRVEYQNAAGLASLGSAEAAMMADFPRLDRIHIEDQPDEIMLESILAQGVALRMNRTPEFVANAADADISIGFELDADLTGPEIRFDSQGPHQILIAGRQRRDLETVARVFASRSIRSGSQVFRVADALNAGVIGRESTQSIPYSSALGSFANAQLPFGEGRGAQASVIVTEPDGEARLAALSIMSRTALAHQTAWIYAWYGTNSFDAPADRHTVFIGTGALTDRAFVRGAPAEFRTALRAAAAQTGQRNSLRLSSAAYADDLLPAASGVATAFTDPENPTRWIAGFTSPRPSGFLRASQMLSRSDHWSALNGRAAFWDEGGVTAYDYSVDDDISLAQRYGLPELTPREIAFVLFMLAGLFLLRAIWRRRRIHDKSTGWR